MQAQIELQPVGFISPLPQSMLVPILSSEGNIQEKSTCHGLELHPGTGEPMDPCSGVSHRLKTHYSCLTRWQSWDFIGHFLAQPCFASCAIMVFLRSELLSLSCNSTDMTALTLNLGSFHIEGSTLLRTRAGQYTFISPKGIAG